MWSGVDQPQSVLRISNILFPYASCHLTVWETMLQPVLTNATLYSQPQLLKEILFVCDAVKMGEGKPSVDSVLSNILVLRSLLPAVTEPS